MAYAIVWSRKEFTMYEISLCEKPISHHNLHKNKLIHCKHIILVLLEGWTSTANTFEAAREYYFENQAVRTWTYPYRYTTFLNVFVFSTNQRRVLIWQLKKKETELEVKFNNYFSFLVLGLAMDPPKMEDVVSSVISLKELGSLLPICEEDEFSIVDGDITPLGRMQVSGYFS